MSQQGETHPRHEDEWWRQLYGNPETGEPRASAETVDDHYASALSAVGTPDDPPVRDEPPVRAGTPADAVPAVPPARGPYDQEADELDDHGPPDTLRLRRATPSPSQAPASPPAPSQAQAAAPAPAQSQAPAPSPPAPATDPQDEPPRGGVTPSAGEAWGQHPYRPAPPHGAPEPPEPPGPPQARAAPAPPGPATRPDAPAPPLPPERSRTLAPTAFGEGPVTWSDPDPGPAPELPPGWAAAEPPVETAPPFVGDRPPTYAAEPTAWPVTHPDELDSLVPDTVLDGAQYGVLTLRTASVRGDSARYRGQPRRDALLTARFGAGDDGLLLLAVASGVRASDEAPRAAQDACRWIAGAVGRSRQRLSEDIRAARRGSLKSGLHRLTDRCYGRLRARGEDLGLEEGEYTASLRCLLLPVDPSCRIRLFFGVGDGGLFRIRDGSWQDLDPVNKDTEPEERFRFRASVAHPGDALLLCSGGLAEPLRGEPALAARLAHQWGNGHPPGLTAFLAEAQTRVKGYADDRTAVGVWDA
ncbi:protein phosphatase 2C domain-containing protein [Streptomyces sp. NPDC006733]|uniref:protein phosphatase 2C domain-containing protein n=1 Tax=Streptomyces sp. NPDC006733 TaxID=3155460 RepID=UPI0033E59C59